MPLCHGPGRPPRLPRYDYAQAGCYFLTLCAQDGRCIFGRVVDGRVVLSEAGHAVEAAWEALPGLHPGVLLDARVVMPNHFHGILVLQTPGTGSSHGHLGAVVRTFKSRSAVAVNRILGRNGTVWQRGYYERIVWNDRAHAAIAAYIHRNPENWRKDTYHRPSGDERFPE